MEWVLHAGQGAAAGGGSGWPMDRTPVAARRRDSGGLAAHLELHVLLLEFCHVGAGVERLGGGLVPARLDGHKADQRASRGRGWCVEGGDGVARLASSAGQVAGSLRGLFPPVGVSCGKVGAVRLHFGKTGRAQTFVLLPVRPDIYLPPIEVSPRSWTLHEFALVLLQSVAYDLNTPGSSYSSQPST
jgi:hypothetical protein